MRVMSVEDSLDSAHEALAAGRWSDARSAFDEALVAGETAEAYFGLAVALWWLGENREAVVRCARAYALFRRRGDLDGAVHCAVWLAITYKANFADFAVANGWLARAERILASSNRGALHGWLWVARSYRMSDLDRALGLSEQAVALARTIGDVDLELVAMSQLGLIHVSRGEADGGFALIDEAIAAALAGEGSSLETVVFACCDMLNACELVNDIDRAAQWCRVADEFVGTYGCPFLYAECRIYYGSVLAAKGRWSDAERELAVGLRITEGICPGLYDRALIRLAALRVRQGRLEESAQLIEQLGIGVEAERDAALASAALLLARGDALGAARRLSGRLPQITQHQSVLVPALDLLVDARLATGDTTAAAAAADRLAAIAAERDTGWLRATASAAAGRVARACGDMARATSDLEAAAALWASLEMPYEVARCQFDLALACAATISDLAIEHARKAIDGFQALGAAIDADRVAAFLRSMGAPARMGPRGVSTLTIREQQVLSLLGAGLSNPEIAARLYVSRKTASHHVSSVLMKLNLRNRSEAAAYAATLPASF